MAEAGRPGISSIDATGMRVGIVAAQWNAELCNQMSVSYTHLTLPTKA